MFLISIDPHVKQCAVAFFVHGKLDRITTVDTSKLIWYPDITLSPKTRSRSTYEEKYLVIERPYVGINAKTSITLAITVGKIMGSFIRSGFEVHEAPAWGVNGSWISDMLSLSRRMPTRIQVAKLSMKIARAEYPNFDIDKHSAAAILMGMWFLRGRIYEQKR